MKVFYSMLYRGEVPTRDPFKDAQILRLTSDVKCPHCGKIMHEASENHRRRWVRQRKNTRLVMELWPVKREDFASYIKKWTSRVNRKGAHLYVAWRDDGSVLMVGLVVQRTKNGRYDLGYHDKKDWHGDFRPGWPKFLR